MRIFFDKEKTASINNRLWERYGSREKIWNQSGYHVSECSNCEVKCFNNRIGLKQIPSRKTIGFLIFGIISEQVVMSICPEEQNQYPCDLNQQIFGHFDSYENFTNVLEAKATAKRIFKAKDIPVYWVVQLVNYITMSKSLKGWFIFLSIFTRTFSAFCIELEPSEKLMQIEVLMDKVKRFDYAILHKDTSHLTIDPSQYDLCQFKKKCSRRQECKEKYNKHKKNKKDKKKK